jgi:hypothetical protein
MLIDAQHAGADGAAPLGQLAAQVVLEPALDGSAADVFSPPQAAAVHPIIVRPEHTAPERLGRLLARQDAGEALSERTAAIPAQEFRGPQLQYAMAQHPSFVPRLAHAFLFDAEPAAVGRSSARHTEPKS